MARNSLIITQIIFTIGAVASVFLLSDTSEVIFTLLSMELKGLLLSFVFFQFL
jgi:hypothetical protein